MKIIPPGVAWEQALRAGYTGKILLRPYLDWLKTLVCDTCQRAGTDYNPIDPSHYNGYKGTGTKGPDPLAIPQCRQCHDDYEHNSVAWEIRHGPFMVRCAVYLTRAIWEGRLRWEKQP